MKADVIKPLKFKAWNYDNVDISKVRELSASRIAENEGFNNIREYIKNLKELRADRTYNLEINKLLAEQDKIERDSKKINREIKYLKKFSLISNLKNRSFKSEKLRKVAEDNEKNWFEQLEKDIQLNESLMILKDMVKLQKEKS
ncbi:MAG: carboxy terminal-processing peptidase [Candidatus Aminicenantes bacterium]|nr:carboxy terminal-processing peptidase [Candidatus Aminicenantes bacterium]